MASILSKTPPSSAGWDTTHWATALNPAHHNETERRVSWTYLYERSHRPLERYATCVLARPPARWASDLEDDEVVQLFFVNALREGWLAGRSLHLSSFRVCAQLTLRELTRDMARAELRHRRRPRKGRSTPSLVLPAYEPSQDLADYDRCWTEVLVAHALELLAQENPQGHLIIRDLLDNSGEASGALPERLGLSPSGFPALEQTARRHFSMLVEQELRETVTNAKALHEEWRTLSPHMP